MAMDLKEIEKLIKERNMARKIRNAMGLEKEC